ncbi:MAG: rhodanese-like domain-containing protein [Gammaproteobacteria bacterium]|nr:rhodanese-like domain-containing protein [Gammaproteobacteria bacterium]
MFFKELIDQGAIVVDVRSAREFRTGHVTGSKNIPLDMLNIQMRNLPNDRPIITCCASGARSRSAADILLSSGFKDVVNGGPWNQVEQQLR